MKTLILTASITILLSFNTRKTSIPAWVMEDWENNISEGGVWVADNSEYFGKNESYEAYGIKWEWGFGKKSIKGRLYGIKDGKDIGTFWEFHSVWHPLERHVMDFQYGSDGTLGMGETVQIDENHTEQSMKFFNPDGSSFQVGHRAEFKNEEKHTQSYNILEDGTWVERRFYIWKKSK